MSYRSTLIICLLLSTLWVVLPGFAGVPEPAPCHLPPGQFFPKSETPPAPAEHDRGFDVLSYDLDLILDPTAKTISGHIEIGLQSLQNNFQLVHLDLVSNLQCLQVNLGGEPLFFEHSGDSLIVHFPEPLASAQVETLSINWEGRPLPHGSFRAGLMFRQHHAGTLYDTSDDMPIIASVSETWSAHSWWPCKDHPADKALVSLAATVPDTLSLVSNGVLLGIDSPREGWTRYRWREAHPLPTYLVSVAASNYRGWTENCVVSSEPGTDQSIPLGYHVFPHDYDDGVIDLAVTCEAMEFMTDIAGPYPFDGEKYDQVEISWGGAMEHTTATSLPTIFFAGTGQFENLLVHELSHHWFGNSLTPALWQDIWLNEGFARYCEALWLEHRMGRSAYAEFMQRIGPVRHAEMFVGHGLLADPDPIMPNILVYDKGAWLLHSLRLLLGDQIFFQLLKDYANHSSLVHANVVTADFISLAEQAAGRSLDHFFEPWLHTEAVAELFSEIEVEPSGETGAVRLNFQQLQEVWLEMAIPVTLHCGAGESDEVLIMNQRTQQFTINVDCRVDSVTVDREGLVFMKMANAPARFLEVQGPWPNPMNSEGADFQIHLLAGAEISLGVYDVRGRRIHQGGPGFLEATGPRGKEESTPHIWHWEPDTSQRSAAGIYWFEFRVPGHRTVRKATLVH